MAAFAIHQVELVQPPSMMEKQAKTKPKAEKKAKVAESPAPEESPVQPAQTIAGTVLLISHFMMYCNGTSGNRARSVLPPAAFSRCLLVVFFHLQFCL